jgi:hypothetical protein
MAVENVSELAPGVWAFDLEPHEVRMFGDCRQADGDRSILLVTGAVFDRAAGVLSFLPAAATPLNVGSSSSAVAIASDTRPDNTRSKTPTIPALLRSAGDREFLALCREIAPSVLPVAEALLAAIRSQFPGALKRGLRNNFSETPDNFWYVIVQPRSGSLSVTVRGDPSRFDDEALPVSVDRPGYSRFKVSGLKDVDGAVRIILKSRRR